MSNYQNPSHNQTANISNFHQDNPRSTALSTMRMLNKEDRKVWSGMDGAARQMMELNSISLNPDNCKRSNQTYNLNNNPQNPILYASIDTPGFCMRKYALPM
jgi:hypothetical protein